MAGGSAWIEKHSEVHSSDEHFSDANILKQVRLPLSDTKAALREAIINQQRQGFQASPRGDLMAEKRITVLVDYPTRKERTTTYKEKVFYEREYLRKTMLMYEAKLPSYNEELGRKVLQKDQDGIGGGTAHTRTQAAPTSFDNRGKQQLEKVNSASNPLAANGYSHPRTGSGNKTSSLEAKFQGDNPFRGFVQPAEEEHFLAAPADGRPNQDLAEPNARAKKKKFGLKWFFSQPFRSGKESRPEVEELTGRHPFALENGAQKVLESSRPASPLPAEQPEPARSTEPSGPVGGKHHMNGTGEPPVTKQKGPPEVAAEKESNSQYDTVRKNLLAGLDDKPLREYYTQVEEQSTTKERTETYIQHQYFLREYVIRVFFVGERALGRKFELLSRDQYLLDGGRPIERITPNYASQIR